MEGIYGIPETFSDNTPESPDPKPAEEVRPEPSAPRNQRPTHAVIEDRDDRVYEYVKANPGVSRSGIAEALGLTPHQTYLSLNRLGSGRVRTRRVDNAHLWFPVTVSRS